MKKLFEKIKTEIKFLIEDVKKKQLTKRVKVMIACLCSAVLIIAAVIFILMSNSNSTNNSEIIASSNNEDMTDAISDSSSEVDSSDNKEEGSITEDEKLSESEIEEVEASKVLLPETQDAGESYIDETLFIGDSNTVRMMNYGITSVDNTLAVVGMGIQSVKTLKCIQFSGYDNPVTMVDAVKLMQPRRIIITFGTNNANGMSTVDFATKYKEALEALNDAYPYADILINTVPPISEKNSYPKLSQKSIDEFNDALYQLAEAMGCKLLDTASVMKDDKTGFAKENFTVGDGIHLSDSGFAAMFTYIRTHSLAKGDSRPTKLASIPKQIKETYVIDSSGKMNNDPEAYKKMSEVSKEQKEALKKAQEEALKAAEETQKKVLEQSIVNKDTCKHLSSDVSVVKEPTEDSYGIRRYTCRTCGYIYDEQIPKKQPQVTERTESSKQEHQHSYQKVETVPAQVGVAGYEKYRCSCGSEYKNTIQALPAPTPEPTPTQPEQKPENTNTPTSETPSSSTEVTPPPTEGETGGQTDSSNQEQPSQESSSEGGSTEGDNNSSSGNSDSSEGSSEQAQQSGDSGTEAQAEE